MANETEIILDIRGLTWKIRMKLYYPLIKERSFAITQRRTLIMPAMHLSGQPRARSTGTICTSSARLRGKRGRAGKRQTRTSMVGGKVSSGGRGACGRLNGRRLLAKYAKINCSYSLEICQSRLTMNGGTCWNR